MPQVTTKLFLQANRPQTKIVPVFLPFAACPQRCVYCSQQLQSGSPANLCHQLRAIFDTILQPQASRQGFELAFYGGTFTLLAPDQLEICLNFLDQLYSTKSIIRARCSTRPDAVEPQMLSKLLSRGIQLVELGVQSFQQEALSSSLRGYDSTQALEGCHAVLDAGLELGIQLLPGMPGQNPEMFLEDVRTALALKPACMRFYPCLVPEGTVLAQWWRQGLYKAWSLETTVEVLGKAMALAWKAQVPVIRLSVAPEKDFDQSLLAGPRHPALGALIHTAALWHILEENILQNQDMRLARVRLPKFCQGFAFGHAKAMKSRWQSLALESLSFHQEPWLECDFIAKKA